MATDLFRVVIVQPSIHVIELSLPDVVDGAEFDHLNQSLLAAIDSAAGQRWVLDLTGISYVGSAMLGLMVNVRQRIKSSEGKLVLCGLSERLNEIFHACSMQRLFTITRTRADALKAAGR